MTAPPCDRFERTAARDDAAAWADLEAHAPACPECTARLRLWKGIAEAAPTLRKEWDSPDLFRRIEAGIEKARGSASEGSAQGKRRFAWVPAAAIAALVVLSIVGVRVFREGGGREPLARPSARPALLTDAALTEVEVAEKAYLDSIEKLSRLAGPSLRDSSSPWTAAYREKLVLLDSEIAEMRGEIERNRFNTHLRRELLAIYREKQRTLQDLMKGES